MFWSFSPGSQVKWGGMMVCMVFVSEWAALALCYVQFQTGRTHETVAVIDLNDLPEGPLEESGDALGRSSPLNRTASGK